MSADSFSSLIKHSNAALIPLKEAFSDLSSFQSFMLRLGWGVEEIPTSFSNIIHDLNQLETLAETLNDQIRDEETEIDFETVNSIINGVKGIYNSIDGISEVPTGIPSGEEGNFWDEIKHIGELLIIDYLFDNFPALYNTLYILDIIDFSLLSETSTRPSYLKYTLNFSNLLALIKEPAPYLKTRYQWGTSEFKFKLFGGQSSI